MINAQRTDDGKFQKFAWPGGYPCYALLADGETLCIDCANGANGSDASDAPSTDAQWRIEAIDVNWEDAEMTCAHCNARIESAYADRAIRIGGGTHERRSIRDRLSRRRQTGIR